MAFKRNIIKELEFWKKSRYRKPLILRGARQVGKTTAINKFGESFDNFMIKQQFFCKLVNHCNPRG